MMKMYEVPVAEIVDFAHDYVVAADRGHAGGGGGTNSISNGIESIDAINDLH